MKGTLFTLLFGLSSICGFGQILQNYSNNASIRHYAIDSLRIGGGVVMLDYNNDGLDDIYLAGGEASHQLYENLGGFSFRRVTEEAGLAEINVSNYGVNAADLNNDGWVDLFIGTGEGQPSVLLKNNGNGTFTDVSDGSGVEFNRYWSTAVTFADLNNDGVLDIYVGNYARNPTVPLEGNSTVGAYPNELFLSTGEEFSYEESAEELGIAGAGFTLAVRATDPDQDHDMDLYVVNDFGGAINEGNRYYENDGQGNFAERSQELGLDLSIFGMGAGLGDYDADGDFDWYVSDIGQNHLLRREADGTYVDITSQTSAIGDFVSWGGDFFDGNQDSQPDLFMANGAVLGEGNEPLLYYQNDNSNFSETRINLVRQPFYARGVAFADLDADGDLDIVVNIVAEESQSAPLIPVLRNISDLRASENKFFQVRLASSAFNANAYGSILKLYLANGSQLIRMVDNGGTFASRHGSDIHFGIADQQIDSLEVYWPDGTRQVFTGLFPSTLVQIHDSEGLTVLRGTTVTAVELDISRTTKIYPVPAKRKLFIETEAQHPAICAKLYTTDGQLVHQYYFTNSQENTRVITLPDDIQSGIYLLEVIQEKGYFTKKIVVQP